MNSLLRHLLISSAIATSSALAAPVSLPNAYFEDPSAGRIANGFDSATDIPGWKNVGGTYQNSGVELALNPGAAGGYVNATGYVGFLRGTDGGAYQVTTQTISAGQVYRLSWKAGSISSLAGTTNQQVRLFRTTNNGVTRTPLVTSTTILNATEQVFETYVMEYTAAAGDAGAKIGIEFDNTSTGSGVIGYDDFFLDLNPSGPAPATGVPALPWDSGNADDGTQFYTVSTGVDSEFHYRIQTQASLNGGWRSVLRVASGSADIYMSQNSWPTTSSYSYRSNRPTGDDGFVLRPDQFSAGQTWYITVRATAGTTFTLFSGDLFVQDLGALGFTDAPPLNGQYDIGETAIPSGSGAVAVKGEGMRFFKATVPAGTPAWSLWLNGDTRDLAVRRTTVPYHSATSYYDRKQSGQMLVVPTYLGTGTDTYFISVNGNPGDSINLDSRIQEVEVLPMFETTKSNVQVSGPPYRVYRTDVPVDQIAWDVSTTANSGNPNVCVRKNNVPAEWDNDAYSEAPGTATDSVTLVPDFLTNGTWFITVYSTGAYNFTLKSGNPTVTQMSFTDTKINDQTNRAGWRFYALSGPNAIPDQLGSLGWELLLSGQVPGSQISIRRNKVPSRWQYRTNGSTYVNDTQVQYADYSSTSGFLQRPGHQADVWYVGVFTPQQPLGGFVLETHKIDPPEQAFDGSISTITGQEAGKWVFKKIIVPGDANPWTGWDVRVKNVTGGGTPRIAVRRDLLPSSLNSPGWYWLPDETLSWPSGATWSQYADWTGRTYEAGSNVSSYYSRLVSAKGRPLEAGTYYVGVYNDHATSSASYTLESRGIGSGRITPVADLPFNGGTVPVTNLAPREAAYFKVTVPASTPSWEFTLDSLSGEMMMAVRRGTIPDFNPNQNGNPQADDTNGQDLQTFIQKSGVERYVMLPRDGQDFLVPGDYYIAVVSEGQNPSDTSHIGTGTSSGTLTSRGPLVVQNLGEASLAGLTTPVSLAAGQIKAYTFTVPAGTDSLEVRLDNRVGNPWMNLLSGSKLPWPAQSTPGQYYQLGYYGNNGTFGNGSGLTNGSLVTVANPSAGTYTLVVRAAATTMNNNAVLPDASADLVVIANTPTDVAFDGGTSSMSNQPPGAWRFFRVVIPGDANPWTGWDVRVKNVTGGGTPRIAVRRDLLPSSLNSPGWYWLPDETLSWPSGATWSQYADWTGRTYEAGSNVSSYYSRLVSAKGRPLEAGTYYVGVYNDHATSSASYTLESRGIGSGRITPVADLPFNGGTVPVTNLAPREAAYFKVTVPASTPSWEFTLDSLSGEMMMAVRRGTIPDFNPNQNGNPQADDTNGQDLQTFIQKSGVERYVMLPRDGQDFLVPGDYYIAVVSEGQNPSDTSHIGTGTSSGTLTSRGPLVVQNLGEASLAGLTTPVSLAAGQIKAYTFTVPAGTDSLEVRLDNRVGNPWMNLLSGSKLPWPAQSTPGQYYQLGYYGNNGTFGNGSGLTNGSLVTVANPSAGTYTLVVRAAATTMNNNAVLPDASADLVVIANTPTDVAFDGGTSSMSNQPPGAWRFFRVVIPGDANPWTGWDVRVKNVTGGGTPRIAVRRDLLPSSLNSPGWYWLPDETLSWPSGATWSQYADWTGRTYEAGSNVSSYYSRLVSAKGRPLEAGTYYVGVYNDHATSSASYTLESRGIGSGRITPVADLPFNGGTVPVTNLAPREAAYFKVTVPASTPSWEFTLDSLSGEMMMAVRRGTIPDFNPNQNGNPQADDTNGQDLQTFIQKSGVERYVMLPRDGQDFLVPGDYYIAVVSEGQNPSDTSHIGTGTSSGTLTSRGPLVVQNLGEASLAGLTTPVSLAAGQIKAYTFTVPAGTDSLEVRLDNRVGNPWMNLLSGSKLPWPAQSTPGQYYQLGYYGNNGTFGNGSGLTNGSLVTVANPSAGTYTLVVRAAATTMNNNAVLPDASADLVVRQKPRVPLNFAASLNAGGGTNTDSQQLLDGQKTFYEVAVPTSVDGQPVIGWILRNSFQQGNGTIRVYKTWGNSTTGISVNSRTAVIAPPFLTPGDTWYVEVTGIGLTNYTITSEPVTLHQPVWTMPLGHNATFGDSGAALSGDQGIDLGQDDWHFYAVDVPEGNAGLLRTELQAINGNPNLYIREDGVPTTDHYSNGPSGTTLTPRSLTATASEYGNWVPLDGRTEKQLRAGRWYLGVKATGGTNARYRLIVSNGVVRDLPLNSSAGVLSVNVTNGGSGYTDPPIVVFSGGGGTGATANVTLQNGIVVAVNVTNPGSGYTSPPTVVLSGGSGGGATATATFSQTLVGRDWRYYRFTVPADAPINWNLTFGQQVGDVVMWLRDGLPPGNGYDGLESTSSQGSSGLRTWYSDNKNQGPYTYNGYDAQGTYPFNTPPLRPGGTYYVGFKANNDATFTFSSSTSGSSIGNLPVLDFYTGTIINASIPPETSIPPNSSVLYQIPVPPEATRLKWTSTHPSTVQMRLEQGTLPASTGTAQHYYSSGANSAPNYALSASTWPWQPSQTYYLRIVNNAASAATVTLNMKGTNAATEDEDSDGLPDAWELTYFPTGSIYSYNGSSDPDLDGVTNAVEFVDGTNPNNINSALYFVTVNASGGSVLRSPILAKYPRGSFLSLTPTPDSGLAFIGWTGGVTGTSSPANLTVNSNLTITATFGLPIETAVETSALAWSTGGSGLWYGQNITTHDGVDAAQSGVIGNSQESWMETTVTGPGTLTFWWKVSSQANGDFLQFLLDGAIQSGSITGTVNWAQKSIPISAGNHTLRWRYLKDGSTVSGSDAGWVDEVVWSPTSAYGTWAATKFTAPQLADSLISGPSADPDKDGMVNLLECAFNTLPLTPGNQILASGSGTIGLPLITKIGSGATTRLRIEYIRRKSGLTYSPEVSDALSDAGWMAPTGTPVVTSIDAEWERVVVEDTAGTGQLKRFGRVKVTSTAN